MDTISFEKLLLTSAFCCMASDGDIDNREIALIKSMCDNSPLFTDFNIQGEISALVTDININGKEFISNYFDILSKSSLTVQEELTLIDFAIQTIKADEQIQYSEIKFFKILRHHLKISNTKILEVYPDIEQFLNEDIDSGSYLKLANQYFDTIELPQFELISIGAFDNLTGTE